MSGNYYRKRKKRLHDRAMAGVRKREANRLATRPDGPDWTRMWTMLLTWWAHRDGWHVTLYADGQFLRCGSERAVTAAVRKLVWRRPLSAYLLTEEKGNGTLKESWAR